MFGYQNDKSSDDTNGQDGSAKLNDPANTSTVAPSVTPNTDASNSPSEPSSAPPINDPSIATGGYGASANSLPMDTSDSFDDAVSAPAVTSPTAVTMTESSTDVAGPSIGESTELLGLKQQALQQLSPLIDHLDQTPEEKFRTTMMMIQANDNQTLIKNAYEAAQEIIDEKVRAQALLDIVNEINYFTQKKA